MQLPLNVVQQFGRFAYQDEQQGIEVITAIQDFIEEYQNGSVSSNESLAKVVKIERNQAGIVTVAKSIKILPNIRLNLRALIKNMQENLDLKDATNLADIFSTFLFSNWITKVVAALRFIQFAIDLKTIELTGEQAEVLVALHHLCRGELQLEIPLSELQAKMQANYHFNLNESALEDVLEDLIDLHCISRQQDAIYLTEKVILKES